MKKKTKDTSIKKKKAGGSGKPIELKTEDRLKTSKTPYSPPDFPGYHWPVERHIAVIDPYSPVGVARDQNSASGRKAVKDTSVKSLEERRAKDRGKAAGKATAKDRRRASGNTSAKDRRKAAEDAFAKDRRNSGGEDAIVVKSLEDCGAKERGKAAGKATAKDRRKAARETLVSGTSAGKMPAVKLKAGSCDFVYAAVVAALLIFGVVMVFSASSYTALKEYNDSLYFFKRECAFALIGVAFMITAAFVPMKLISRFTPLVCIVSFALLLLLFTPMASVRNDSARWIEIGGFTIMPGEIAKFAAILFVARFLSSRPEKIRSLFKGIIPLLLYCGVNFYLIYKQPSLATAITLAGIIMGTMFVAGMNLIYVGGALGAASVGLFTLIVSDETGYHFKRMVSFLDPFTDAQGGGYQVVQSLLGLGAGGVFGVGLGNSIQKALYLPEGHNDFILAIIGEELGFVGCLALLLAYMVLIFRGTWIAIKAPDRFSMLTAAGITIMFALQVIMNVLVVTSWMPPTGVVLPFVSYGGNSLILYLAQAGIMLNISRRINAQEVPGTGGTEIYSVRTNIRERKPEVRLAGGGRK